MASEAQLGAWPSPAARMVGSSTRPTLPRSVALRRVLYAQAPRWPLPSTARTRKRTAWPRLTGTSARRAALAVSFTRRHAPCPTRRCATKRRTFEAPVLTRQETVAVPFGTTLPTRSRTLGRRIAGPIRDAHTKERFGLR